MPALMIGLAVVGRKPCHNRLTKGLEGLISQSEPQALAASIRTVGNCGDGLKHQLVWHRRALHWGWLLSRLGFDDCNQLARLRLEAFQFWCRTLVVAQARLYSVSRIARGWLYIRRLIGPYRANDKYT